MIKNKLNIKVSRAYFIALLLAFILSECFVNKASTEAYRFVTKWGYLADGQFSNPNGIAVDASGNVYVADSRNERIQKFNSNGTFITKWGSTGSLDGQFLSPMGISVDASGNVYVADTYNERIQKFSSNGEFITK